MKKLFLILFVCLLAGSSFGQKDYAQISGNFDVSKPLGNGGGGSFDVQHIPNKNASLGAGFDIIKFKNLEKILPSVYIDLRYHFGNGIKKPLIYFALTPGYSFYNASYHYVSGPTYSSYDYTSGFSFGSGLGCILYSGKKLAPFISAMYYNFPLSLAKNNSNNTVRYDVIKLNFGITF